jgi:hypothetical protein
MPKRLVAKFEGMAVLKAAIGNVDWAETAGRQIRQRIRLGITNAATNVSYVEKPIGKTPLWYVEKLQCAASQQVS